MPVIKCDTAVIGGGMAATTAALTASGAGKKTVLISKGAGASIFSSGAIDICSSPISGPFSKWNNLPDVPTNILETITRNPNHPYAKISAKTGGADAVVGKMDSAVSFLKDKLGAAGLPFKGSTRKQIPIPTSLGTWKLSSLLQMPQQAGTPEVVCAVVGIKGLDFPDAVFLAEMFEAGIKAKGITDIAPFEAFEVDIGLERLIGIPQLYELLSIRNRWEHFIDCLNKTSHQRKQILLIPPVIPYNAASSEENLKLPDGTVIREMAAGPMNAAGMRLGEAFKISLDSAGVVKISGSAVNFEAGGGSIKRLYISDASGETAIEADKWVIATGKFIGGGIVKSDCFVETIFDLPLFCGDTPVKKIWTQKLLGKFVMDRHDAFSIGIATDSDLRPIDADGKVIYENLFAAGSILGGYNYHTDGCGMGVCILTGSLAGMGASS